MSYSAKNSQSLTDYWIIARRRFWLVVTPLFLCWVAVWGFSWRLPDTYQSDAVILVQQQEVPQNYVVSNVTLNLQDRLQSMTQQILSRTRLQTTINRFHLYPKHAGFGGFAKSEDPIDQMRKDIKIVLVESPGHRGELTAFKIQYSAGSPELAQQVNSELTSLFIDENLKSAQRLSEATTEFLTSHLTEARAKLEEQEAKVRAFKATHFGDLPSQMQGNVQILSGLQAQLETTQRDLNAARQQKLYLESLQGQYEAQLGRGGSGDSPEGLDKVLSELRLSLTNARTIYTDDHPEVISLKDKIAKTEKLRKELEDEAVSNKKIDTETASIKQSEQNTKPGATPSMMQIHSQLQANALEISNYEHQEKIIAARISDYQARLNLTPQTEQELMDVSRGYEESVSNYNSLLQKQNQSQLATSLEQHQQGEQFRILDPPSLPTKPSSPNHLMISLGGLILGAAIGTVMAAHRELADVRIWQAKDLEGLVPTRVLVTVPHLSTPVEDRLGPPIRWMKLGIAVIVGTLIVLGNLYSFYKG